MTRSDWNSLRAGDPVEVHDPAFPVTAFTAARVLRVTVHARQDNDIAIRLDGNGRVIRPAPTTVHRPNTPDTDCWRCAELHQAKAA